MNSAARKLFDASAHIRYVALHVKDELQLAERPNLRNTSSSESDKYEELIVNPTLLELARRRGAIDCGGLEFLLIRYGNFFQLVLPVKDGHLSVAFEPEADPLAHLETVRAVARASHLL